jgi:hypothetical protein
MMKSNTGTQEKNIPPPYPVNPLCRKKIKKKEEEEEEGTTRTHKNT